MQALARFMLSQPAGGALDLTQVATALITGLCGVAIALVPVLVVQRRTRQRVTKAEDDLSQLEHLEKLVSLLEQEVARKDAELTRLKAKGRGRGGS